MLLDLAGIDKDQRIMVQASIANARDYEKVADALVVQDPRIHLRESRTSSTSSTSGKGGRGGWRRFSHKGHSRKGGKGRQGKFQISPFALLR